MSAQIIILPVIRAMNAPAANVDPDLIKMEIGLERGVMNKLCAVAELADSPIERMAEALIVWDLAAIEQKSPEEFYDSLKVQSPQR
jgi:hypothetical protein